MAFGRHVRFSSGGSVGTVVLVCSIFLCQSLAFAQGSPDVVWSTAGYSAVHSAAYSPDGMTIASSGYSYLPGWQLGTAVRLWLDEGRRVETLATDSRYLQVSVVAFSQDGQLIAARYPFGLGIWRLTDRVRIHGLSDVSPSCVAFSPDGAGGWRRPAVRR